MKIQIRTYIFFLSLLCTLAAVAQPMSGRNTYKQMVETADEQFQLNEYHNALEWYQKAFDEIASNELQYKIAHLLYLTRNYEAAEKAFAKVEKKDKDTSFPETPYWLAMMQKMNGKYDDAIKGFEAFAKETEDVTLKKRCALEVKGAQFALKATEPDNVKVENAGKDVNSASSEASPALNPKNDKELLYASFHRNKESVRDGKEGDLNMKIYAASKTGNDWSGSKVLNTVVNRESQTSTSPSFSKDGNTMYFTRAEFSGELVTASKVFMSKREKNGDFGPATELKGINGNYIVKHPVQGELFGKEVLFFSSNMDGGQGGYDLYYSTKKGDDGYELPVNLGNILNTMGDEITPFYRDGKLWFSSNGHPSMGGLDIFSTAWNGTAWSNPVNMGKQYNSPADDHYYSVSADGYTGFVVSNRLGTTPMKGFSKTCCDDIWTANVERVTSNYIETVFTKDKKGKEVALSGANLQIIELTDNKLGKTETKENLKSNNFEVPLTLERSYMAITCKTGYVCDTFKFNSNGIVKSKNIEHKAVLALIPVKIDTSTYEEITVGEKIRLNNIYYDYDSDVILPDAEGDLKYLADIMKQYPDLVIELSSHTDSRGKDEYNLKLSQRRANSAVRYMNEKQGIAIDRLKPVGFGETQLLNRCTNTVKDCTDDEHRFNRRTEFKILSGPETIVVKKRIKKNIPKNK